MDKTYIHSIITGLPIFASMLGAGVLAYGLWKKSDHTITAAYFLLIIGSVGAGTWYYTGGFAAKTLKALSEVTQEEPPTPFCKNTGSLPSIP